MCGIYAFASLARLLSSSEMASRIVESLGDVNSRGTDAAGLCILNRDAIVMHERVVGDADELRKKIADVMSAPNSELMGRIGLGHTRWATNGGNIARNAQPMMSDPANSFCLIFNGVMENFEIVKNRLMSAGYTFDTPTDTEVVAKLFLYYRKRYPTASFEKLCKKAFNRCAGDMAIVVASPLFPDTIVACVRNTPLIVGVTNDTHLEEFKMITEPHVDMVDVHMHRYAVENGSDVEICSESYGFTNNVTGKIHLENNEIFKLTKDRIEFFVENGADRSIRRTSNSSNLVRMIAPIECSDQDSNGPNKRDEMRCRPKKFTPFVQQQKANVLKQGYNHRMKEEIDEQYDSISKLIDQTLDRQSRLLSIGTLTEEHLERLHNAKDCYFIACGTSLNSSKAASSTFSSLLGIRCHEYAASDFLDKKFSITSDDVAFFISQSGETQDTKKALVYCKAMGALCISVTNRDKSSISQEAHCDIKVHAGHEISVASTKAYTNQFLTLVLAALYIHQTKGLPAEERRPLIDAIIELPEGIKKSLNANVCHFVDVIKKHQSALFTSRGVHHASILEGALKLLEVAYIHANAITSGELKHGPLALVCNEKCVIVIASNEPVCGELIDISIQQISTRQCIPLIICTDKMVDKYANSGSLLIAVPETHYLLQGILTIIPLQNIAYEVAISLNLNPDRPRNLAKAVTVN